MNYARYIPLVLAPLALIAVMAQMQGCSLDEFIQVDVPPTVRQHLNAPATLSLRDARYLADQYESATEQGVAQLRQSIQDAAFWEGAGAFAVDLGMVVGEGALAGVPGGALLTTLLGLGAGYVVPRRKDKKAIDQLKQQLMAEAQAFADKLRQEKEDSYNKGHDVGMQAAGQA